MAGSGAQGGPGLVPPPQEPSQPQGLPPHMAGPPGQLNPPPGPPGPPPFGSSYGVGGPSANGKFHRLAAEGVDIFCVFKHIDRESVVRAFPALLSVK